MKKTDIELEIVNFKKKSNLNDRYTSFDYCYNYFRTTNDLTRDIEKSCLVLGFYLASWGMFRGSSFLLLKSVKHFEKAIIYIDTLDKSVWDIDVDRYDEKNIQLILEIYSEIKKCIIEKENSDLTLITKILLGVFGFIPAFDNNFCNAFRTISEGKCGFRKANVKSLSIIKTFYELNKSTIDRLSSETYTKDFITGQETKINYTKAKIIDMYGFQLGLLKTAIT